MKAKRLGAATAAITIVLVAAGSGAGAAERTAADVWIESLDVTCPDTGGLEVTMVADASAETAIVSAEAILTEMTEVTIDDGFYPYPTSIRVAEWWKTQQYPVEVPVTIGFRTKDDDFDSTTWEGDKHHFWNPALTDENASEGAWFRASAWVEGRTARGGRPGGSWDMDELQVYHNCATGQSFTPEGNPWEGWNYPDE